MMIKKLKKVMVNLVILILCGFVFLSSNKTFAECIVSGNSNNVAYIISNFCNKEKQITLEGNNFCELIEYMHENKYKNKYDVFAIGDWHQYAIDGENIEVYFDKDKTLKLIDIVFAGEFAIQRYSMFFIGNNVIFFRDINEVDLANVTVEHTTGSFYDFPRVNYIEGLIMDKEGNYKIYISPNSDKREVTYEDFKKDFDEQIKFLREDLPIKIEY